MNRYQNRLNCLRESMRKEGITVYYVPTADYHGSEYISDHFKIREYLSGFTGSAGTLFVTDTEAGLFTDGRYFTQAEQELMGSGITLYRSGMEHVPSVEEKLCELLTEGSVLGFDGRLVSYSFVAGLKKMLKDTHVSFQSDAVLPAEIWPDRPALFSHPAYRLDLCFAGKSAKDKLSDLRRYLSEEKPGIDACLISSLDDIAWLFNIRGTDILYNPVVLSYALVTKDDAFLYLFPEAVDASVADSLKADGVTVRNYDDIYDDLRNFSLGSLLLDAAKTNYALTACIPSGVTVKNGVGPISPAKAVKNETEQRNLRIAHQKDGIALTKFMYWLKKNIGKEPITELSAADKLLSLRKEQEGFLEPSFETISAYNENAAMMHYTATPDSFAVLRPQGFLLVDSGGQYPQGTTDVTRTYVLGEVPLLWKQHYTAVLRGMLALSDARFLYGCRGVNLDILARGPLWQMGLDYRCGTGHGVGYLLNVHEAPNGFRWKIVPERNDSCVLEEGMVTTDEPGVYVEGSHGIRIENELLCVSNEKNEYGRFLSFETLTLTPIDLEAVLPDEMTRREKEVLNAYHKKVCDTLLPYMNEEEAAWLKEATKAI